MSNLLNPNLRAGGRFLTRPFGAGAKAAYSLYNLGNQRGSVTETGETVYGDFELTRWEFDSSVESWSAGAGGTSVSASWVDGKLRATGKDNPATANLFRSGQLTVGVAYRVSVKAKTTKAGDVHLAPSGGAGVTCLTDTTQITSTEQTYTFEFTADATFIAFAFADTPKTQGSSSSTFTLASSEYIELDDVILYELDTYRTQDVTYHNPVVRLRRDSDGIHKSFSGVEIGNQTALNWVNEDVVLIDATTNNGGFETAGGGGADVFADWGEIATAPSTITRDTTIFDSGTASANLFVGAGKEFVQISQTLNLSEGQTVHYSARVRSDSTSSAFTMGGNQHLESFGVSQVNTWETITGSFVVTSDTSFIIKRSGSFGSINLWVDDVTITITQANAYATTWYDQSGVGVVSTDYESDFSADKDGWSQVRGTATGNIDGVTDDNGVSKDDCLRFYANADAGTSHYTYVKGLDGSEGPIRATFEYYVPSGQSSVDGLEWRGGIGSATYKTTLPTIGKWTRGEVVVPELELDGDSSGRINFLPTSGGSINFTGANSPTDDVFYLRNVRVELLNKAHNDATQATEASQPKVVDAGAYVLDGFGNYSILFDGTNGESMRSAVRQESIDFAFFGLLTVDPAVIGLNPTIYGDDASGGNRAYISAANNLSIRHNGSLNPSSRNVGTDPALCAILNNSTELTFAVDGVTETDTAQIVEQDWEFIGAGAGTNRFDGTMVMLLLYDVDKSTDRSAIEQAISKILTTALS